MKGRVYGILVSSIVLCAWNIYPFDLNDMSLSENVGFLSFILSHSGNSPIVQKLEPFKPFVRILVGIGFVGYKLHHKRQCEQLCTQAKELLEKLKTEKDQSIIEEISTQLAECKRQLKAYVPEYQPWLLQLKHALWQLPILKRIHRLYSYDAQMAAQTYKAIS